MQNSSDFFDSSKFFVATLLSSVLEKPTKTEDRTLRTQYAVLGSIPTNAAV